MKTDAIFYVYVLFRLDGRPCYVGKGKGDRWLDHERRARKRNPHLDRIVAQAKAQGKELPKVKIRFNMCESEAFEIERAFIGAIGRHAHGGPLVNLTDGGEGASGFKASPETRALQSAIKKGTTLSPECRAKIGASLKGRAISTEHRAKLSAAQKGRKKIFGWWSTEEGRAKQLANNSGNSGNSHTDEARAKIRAARSRQPRSVSPDTQFKIGMRPWNRGLKGYNPSPSTQFKKGYQPSLETRVKLSASVTASWAKRKAASLGQHLT